MENRALKPVARTISLPFEVGKPILACGADLKGAFALARGDKAYLVEGFGPIVDPDNFKAYERSVFSHERALGIRPAVIACDQHPDYVSSRFAEKHGLDLLIPELRDIQHHEAHAAAAMTEHRIKGDAICVVFDGAGYGWDGSIWGGEFFIGGPRRFIRAGHMEYVPMPGGDAVIGEPWRMALSYLYRAYGADLLDLDLSTVRKIGKKRWAAFRSMLEGRINSPFTSSAGRLFDAAASIILSKDRAGREAELPMELESIAAQDCSRSYEFDIRSNKGLFTLCSQKLFRGLISDLCRETERAVMSATFHNTVARMILSAAVRLRKKHGLRKVVLTGGVFQNRYLTGRASRILGMKDFKVYTHSQINTNDYGIPVGQVAIANARRSCV